MDPVPPRCRIVGASHASRTRRSLVLAGCDLTPPSPDEDQESSAPVWLVRSGAWLPRSSPLELPILPDDEPFLGLGATLAPPDIPGRLPPPTEPWQTLLRQCGAGLSPQARHLPPPDSLLLNRAAWRQLPEILHGDDDAIQTALTTAIACGWSIFRLDALDVCQDLRSRMRVVQIITSIQRGGAERLVLDLHDELPRHRVSSTLVTLGSPTRTAFASPSRMTSLARFPYHPDILAREAIRAAVTQGADLVHAHLLNADLLTALRSQAPGLPLVTTVHNQRSGWPQGLETLQTGAADLLISCSQAVESELAPLPIPVRTIWNGIRQPAPPPTARTSWRNQAGFDGQDLVLATLANPRPQKRLPLLAEVFAEVSSRFAAQGRRARLMIAGEPNQRDPAAAAEADRFWSVIDSRELRSDVFWPGSLEDPAGFLCAADLFLSTSLHEGLSLSQLEALALGLPVVTTDVGGAREVGPDHPHLHLVSPDPPGLTCRLAQACISALVRPIPCAVGTPPLSPSFTTPVMTARHRWLYHAVLSHERRRSKPRRGVLLLTNNFSTGGAQSSARRLLTALQAEGEHVRAAVIQEEPDHPTPGRAALLSAGIPVTCLPTPEGRDPAEILLPLLDLLAEDPPQAILLWNVIPVCKLLLTDALWDIPVFDVSPGEMLFDSLARYFTRPHPGLPFLTPLEYGRRLAGVVVKYQAEAGVAARLLGKNAHVIPNGVPLPPMLMLPDRPGHIIGTAARLNPQKKLEDLLAAFRIVHATRPDTLLRIAGGEERGFENYARSLRTSTKDLPVEWLGAVHDLPAFHADLDVFAMISEPSGCPNASLEAMAAGLPVAATAFGGAVDQIIHDECGLLTPRGDARALADALLLLLNDKPLRQRLGGAARARIQANFSMPRMAAAYRSLWS